MDKIRRPRLTQTASGTGILGIVDHRGYPGGALTPASPPRIVSSMLPIANTALPENPEMLQKELEDGFARHGIPARKVQLIGASIRQLDLLSVDLSGVNVTRSLQAPKPGPHGQKELTSSKLDITGQPFYLEGVRADMSLTGENVDFAVAASTGENFLVPIAARDGRIELEISRGALEELLQKVATDIAGKQGVEIKEAHLELTSLNDRSLKFRADVVGKVFLMKAPVSLTGELFIDDELNIHLSNLAVGGSGMIANLANGFAQPHLKRAQAQPIALSMLSFGTLKLKDVRLSAGQSLRLQARFGS